MLVGNGICNRYFLFRRRHLGICLRARGFRADFREIDALGSGFNVCMDSDLFLLIGYGFKRDNGFALQGACVECEG